MFAARNMIFTKASGFTYDPDALAWITAVEAADELALETDVKLAVNAHVLDLKGSPSPVGGVSQWQALNHYTILVGPRTLAGVQVRLKGATAPTFNNFIIGDLNRETGLKGNSSNKWINLNIAGNGGWGTTGNASIGVYVTEGAGATGYRESFFGDTDAIGGILMTAHNDPNDGQVRKRFWGSLPVDGDGTATGLYACSRRNTTAIRVCEANSIRTITASVQSRRSEDIAVLARDISGNNCGNQRISGHFLGNQIDEAAFAASHVTLLAAIAAAIP
jgi:hypothetical protein